MIEEIPTFRYRCPYTSCGYTSEPFDWRAEALAAETDHLEAEHTPILDDEPVLV